MALESQSQKKSFVGSGGNGGFGDVSGLLLMLPKEMFDLDKERGREPPSLELRFQVPDFRPVLRDFFRAREVGEFLSGALAGAMTKAVLAPLETIRTRMVVGVGSKSITGSFLEAIELGTFECVKRAVTSAQEKWNEDESPKLQIGGLTLNLSLSWVSPVAVAGAAAGIASTLACHPLEVLKDRLTVSPDMYPSLRVAVSKIFQDGGIGAFYAGISPTLIGMLPYSTSYYFIYETAKKSYCSAKKKKSLNRPELLLIGALAGFTASTLSFPLEVARKRLMVGALQGKCPPHMAAALAEVVQEQGLMGLYRGWGASCLKVMPSSGITWMFYEAWKDILLSDHPLQ
ncbi:probable mitochondrial adenine nucleotide transporter BTL1 isoform X2 [Punica granatum]|uniref:Probable mitochondrial adenine nucleotide transporter BTL1 isoform X2 n=1 Tax=Punica granatum TaxID=22663 RepID=A0A6P8C4M5_PUNGR|nr:probable mitochondrial adenine nucleotide transporter BTL1 isoform X2 [Punica granatum]